MLRRFSLFAALGMMGLMFVPRVGLAEECRTDGWDGALKSKPNPTDASLKKLAARNGLVLGPFINETGCSGIGKFSVSRKGAVVAEIPVSLDEGKPDLRELSARLRQVIAIGSSQLDEIKRARDAFAEDSRELSGVYGFSLQPKFPQNTDGTGSTLVLDQTCPGKQIGLLDMKLPIFQPGMKRYSASQNIFYRKLEVRKTLFGTPDPETSQPINHQTKINMVKHHKDPECTKNTPQENKAKFAALIVEPTVQPAAPAAPATPAAK